MILPVRLILPATLRVPVIPAPPCTTNPPELLFTDVVPAPFTIKVFAMETAPKELLVPVPFAITIPEYCEAATTKQPLLT